MHGTTATRTCCARVSTGPSGSDQRPPDPRCPLPVPEHNPRSRSVLPPPKNRDISCLLTDAMYRIDGAVLAHGGNRHEAPDQPGTRLKGGGMFGRFTDQARRVVVHAQEEARMLGRARVGSEHILTGLFLAGDSVAVLALESEEI